MLPKPFCNCNLDAFESVVTSTHRSVCIYTWTNLYIQISLDFGSIQCQPFSLLREKGNLGWINGQSETGKSNASGSIPYLLKRVLFSHNTAPHSLSTAHLIGCNKKSEIVRYFQGRLCDKIGLLCDKLCDFFRANLHCFTRFQRRKTTLMLFNRQFECKGIIKHLF